MQDLFSLKGRTALVTGGSRGIGKMIAAGFVGQGAKVYVSSRKAAMCEETARARPCQIRMLSQLSALSLPPPEHRRHCRSARPTRRRIFTSATQPLMMVNPRAAYMPFFSFSFFFLGAVDKNALAGWIAGW